MATPNPSLVNAIRRYGGNLAPLLLATTLVESGGRLDAVGDGGKSHGPYQMYDQGRGYGVPIARRRDPVFSTKSALAEFKRFQGRGYSGAELAYAAQRPADRAGYIRKINAALPEAQRILGSSAGSGVPSPGRGNPPRNMASAPTGAGATQDPAAAGGGNGITPESAAAIRRYLSRTEQQVLAGEDPDPVEPLLSEIQFVAPPPAPAPAAAPRGGNPVRTMQSSPTGGGAPGPAPPAPGGGGILKGAILGSPIPGQQPRSMSHQTSGLPGYPAFDYMAPAGTKVSAPVGGKVVRLSGKDPRLGGAPGGPLGYSVYLQGDNGKRYFMTHIDQLRVRVGQRVRQGEQIAIVADGPSSWSSPHVHQGVSG